MATISILASSTASGDDILVAYVAQLVFEEVNGMGGRLDHFCEKYDYDYAEADELFWKGAAAFHAQERQESGPIFRAL